MVSLFGFMQLGAVVGYFLDAGERRTTLATLQQPHMGFEELPFDVWTWRCVQDPLERAVAPPSGSAMHLATVLGLPFVRLRAAVPECAFAGSVGQALGRQAGLSVHGLQDAREENFAALSELLQSFSCFARRKRIPAFDEGGAADAKGLASARSSVLSNGMSPMARALLRLGSERFVGDDESNEDAELVVGTAMVFAFMTVAKTLPVVEHARRLQAASAHFRGTTLPGIDHGFDALYRMFIVMLSPGNLSGRSDWLEKSRLWRLILLQRADGGFDLNQSLAFALQAHAGAKPPPKPKASKLRALLGALLGGDDLDDAMDDALDDALTSSDDEAEVDTVTSGAAALAHHAVDCPLTFSPAAIKHRLPPALAALNDEYYAEQKAEAVARLQREADEAERARARVAAAVAEVEAAALDAQAQATQPTAWPAQSMVHVLAAAAAKLQHELDDLSKVARTLTPGPQLQRMLKLERATSRRLTHLSSRFNLPLVTPVRCADSTPRAAAAPPTSKAGEEPQTTDSSAKSGRRRRGRPLERLPVERIWSTVLALNVLEELDSCWQVDEDDDSMATIVDRGRAFLHAQTRANRRLRRLFKSGELFAAAERARKEWKAIQSHNVSVLRDTEVINRFTAFTHIQRGSARIVRSMMTDHSTFATFLDTDGYIMRWQRFMVLVTLVLSTLLTSIWFYYSRGANCCLELRAILGCDPAGPCLGFAGDCADIQAQFADLQGPFLYSDGPGDPPTEHDTLADYTCHAFPDDAYITDQFFVGLISVAVALPVDLFLQRAFEIANESESPGNWLDAPPGKWKLLLGKDAHNGWRLADPKRPVSEFVRWMVGGGAESDLQAVLFVIGYLLRRLRARLFGEPPSTSFPEDEAIQDPTPDAKRSGAASESSSGSAEARADALTKRLYAAAGLLGVYVTWTIMSWFIFTYGMLIYKQLGASAQNEFAKVRFWQLRAFRVSKRSRVRFVRP